MTTDENSKSEEIRILESQIEGLNSKLDRIKSNQENIERDLREDIESIKQRLNLLENKDTQQQVTTQEQTKNKKQKNSSQECVLEKLCLIQQEKRKQNIENISLYRATLIWKNYNEWSDKTPKGKILNSKKIKKLLQTLSNEKIKWPQVYRAMEKFNKNSPDQYVYIQEENTKKAILRKQSTDIQIKINNTIY